LAFGQIPGVLKDRTRTSNVDFHAAELESSSPQPLRLLVEEKGVTESAVGQDIAELRWRLATLEGKQLVVCWNATQTDHIIDEPLQLSARPLRSRQSPLSLSGVH
jgi:hypothetical protein